MDQCFLPQTSAISPTLEKAAASELLSSHPIPATYRPPTPSTVSRPVPKAAGCSAIISPSEVSLDVTKPHYIIEVQVISVLPKTVIITNALKLRKYYVFLFLFNDWEVRMSRKRRRKNYHRKTTKPPLMLYLTSYFTKVCSACQCFWNTRRESKEQVNIKDLPTFYSCILYVPLQVLLPQWLLRPFWSLQPLQLPVQLSPHAVLASLLPGITHKSYPPNLHPTLLPTLSPNPHLQADPSLLAAVEGLTPRQDRHQFQIDILPVRFTNSSFLPF